MPLRYKCLLSFQSLNFTQGKCFTQNKKVMIKLLACSQFQCSVNVAQGSSLQSAATVEDVSWTPGGQHAEDKSSWQQKFFVINIKFKTIKPLISEKTQQQPLRQLFLDGIAVRRSRKSTWSWPDRARTVLFIANKTDQKIPTDMSYERVSSNQSQTPQ